MSKRDHTRSCPSCERELSGREHFGEGGLTVIWKCVCGWGSARTVPSALGARTESPAMYGSRAERPAVHGSRAQAPTSTTTTKGPASADLGGRGYDEAMDIRIRKSSGVRAKPVEAGGSAGDQGEADTHDYADSASASRVKRKSDG